MINLKSILVARPAFCVTWRPEFPMGLSRVFSGTQLSHHPAASYRVWLAAGWSLPRALMTRTNAHSFASPSYTGPFAEQRFNLLRRDGLAKEKALHLVATRDDGTIDI